MPDDTGVDIRVRTTGTQRASRETRQVGDNVGRIGRQARSASTGLRLFSRASTSAAGGLRLVSGAAVTGGLAIGGGLLLGVKRSVDAFEEKRKIVAQTGAVLKSTGRQAGVTAAEVDALSTALSRRSGMDDEAITGAQNLLLTFRDVRNEAGKGNDVFTHATGTIVDLSAAMGMDLRSAALQVGKALNDPERGFKRLQRIGVAFSKTQEDQIRNFAATGDRAAAQRVILRELDAEFGGSAAKQATAIDRMKVSWGNVEEAVGKGVSPAVDALADKFDSWFVKAEPQIDALGDRLGHLFRRDDLSLQDKLSLAHGDLSTTFAPVRGALEAEIRQAHVGDRLADAIETGTPIIASAAGRAAGTTSMAFVRGWLHADPGAQLFTLALLSAKMGVFSKLGMLAWARFRAQWGIGGLPTPTTGPSAGPAAGAGGRAGRLGRLGSKALGFLGPVGAGVIGGLEISRALKIGPYGTTGDLGSKGQVVGNHRFFDDGRPPETVRTSAPRRGAVTRQPIVLQVGPRELARTMLEVADDDRARRKGN